MSAALPSYLSMDYVSFIRTTRTFLVERQVDSFLWLSRIRVSATQLAITFGTQETTALHFLTGLWPC